LAYQTYLELAIDYFNKGEKTASIKVLEAAPSHAIIDLWWCYIQQDTGSKYLKEIGVKSPELVFPYRRETLAALKWAQPYGNWKLKYYYALNLWGKDRKAEAAALMQSIENQANYAPFYVARAAFLESFQQKNPLMDLKKAQQLGAKDWRTWQALIRYYLKEDAAETALEWAKKANAQFPDNYAIGMDYAKALNQNKQYEMSIDLLKKIKVLPFEGASAGRRLYAAAYYNQALKLIKEKAYKKAIPLLESSKEWPENLGVGKPFNVDERLPNYLLAHCYEQLGQAQKAMKYWNNIADYSKSNLNRATLNHFLGLKAIEKTAGKAKAKTFLQTLLNSTHKDAFATQWSAARFLKNTRKEKALLPKSKGVRDFLVMMEVADL
jgi:tetratricopeptide (TPR) repeat protein